MHIVALALAVLLLAVALKHALLIIVLILLLLIVIISYAAHRAILWSAKHSYKYPESLHERVLAPDHAIFTANSFNRKIAVSPSEPLFPENVQLEEQFTKVLSIVLVGTLHSWFVHISKRHVFPNAVEHLLRKMAIRCRERMIARDLVGILVRRAVPILTQHLAEFHNAEASVKRLDTAFESGSALEADAIAQKYKAGALHRAAKSQHQQSFRETQQAVLREGIAPKLLQTLLPEKEDSKIVHTLLREIVACSVLYPLFDMLADPDFWNQLIALRAGQAIQERAKIKRFRSVLEEQAVESPTIKQRLTRRKKPIKLDKSLLIGEQKGWDRIYRKIRKSSSLSDLVCLRRELMALKQEVNAIRHDQTSLKYTTKEEAPLNKALALLESRVAVLSGGQRQSYSLSSPAQMSLQQTLLHTSEYLREFLDEKGRADLVDFILQSHALRQHTMEEQLFKGDIQLLCARFLDSAVVAITQDEKTYLMNYVQNEPHDYDSEANEIVQAIAKRAFQILEQEDYPYFRTSDLYQSMMLSGKIDASRVTDTFGFDSSNDHTDEDDEEAHVIECVENALHESLLSVSRPASPVKEMDDIVSAEPGDLELYERIAQINKQMKKLDDHLQLVRQLLQNPANTSDDKMHLMQASQTQISNDLRKLESQKAQFTKQLDEQELFGRSRVSIDSYVMHRDHDGEYTAYLVEVRRMGADGTETGWIIARRYSEFNELYGRLKQHFPQVASIDFPRKQLNRLKSVSEVRRPLLEAFLRNLLADERLCRSKELRAFLSQHHQHFQKKRHRSVLENLLTFTDPRDGVARLFALLEGPDDLPSNASNPDLRDVHPAPGHTPDDDEQPLSAFAKPIVNFILEAFDLRDRGKWIQKRAVVLVLQQILGGTLEGRIRDQASQFCEPRSLFPWLVHLETVLLDKLTVVPSTGTATVRSAEDKRRERELAFVTCKSCLPPYIPDTAMRKIFRAMQNRTLNTHLLYTLADELADAVFS
jgi:sorting nexin-25